MLSLNRALFNENLNTYAPEECRYCIAGRDSNDGQGGTDDSERWMRLRKRIKTRVGGEMTFCPMQRLTQGSLEGAHRLWGDLWKPDLASLH